MRTAYVDTSALAAIVFGENGAEEMARRLGAFRRVLSSNLLEAELRAALAREDAAYSPSYVEQIDWIFPDRPLGAEMDTVLEVGYLKGADLWHVATALSAVPDPREMAFVTLDERQRAVAAELGFRV